MMGAAVLSARGMVPQNTVQGALNLPFRLRMPIMPAEGLYLQYAGFGFVGNKVCLQETFVLHWNIL